MRLMKKHTAAGGASTAASRKQEAAVRTGIEDQATDQLRDIPLGKVGRIQENQHVSASVAWQHGCESLRSGAVFGRVACLRAICN